MTAHLYGGISLDLMDGPVRAEYSRGYDGMPTARLVLGEGSVSIAVSVTASSLDTIDELVEKVAELRAWAQRMHQIKSLPEVA